MSLFGLGLKLFLNMDIKSLLSQLTLEEKAQLCVGASYWHTALIPRLNIPSIFMLDGPNGINKLEIDLDPHNPDDTSTTSIFYPSECCTSCSFDRSILHKIGETIGDEMIKEGISLLLAPGVNIKRSPLCGRNFEYYSEDPFLSSSLASSFIEGVQSKGVGCCIKHFACNNQETNRQEYSSNVDERTLREIYLASFELAIKNAKPWAVMSSYNKVNGQYSSMNKMLLTEILRKEWNWSDGIVISDWGGTYDRVKALSAGLDLEMPGPYCDNDPMSAKMIISAVENGFIDENLLNNDVERVLNVVFKAQKIIELSKTDPSIQFGHLMKNVPGLFDEHHKVAVEIAENSIVLLKNENSILPLPKSSVEPNKKIKILFVGMFATHPHIRGGGSSSVDPYKVENCLDCSLEIVQKSGQVEICFVEGFDTEEGLIKEGSDSQAIEEAENSDYVVVFAGTSQFQESEGEDQTSLQLPEDIDFLITEIANVNKNVVVVLQNGAPLEMPWVDDVKGILETYMCGEGGGRATANILFGLVNPSGHLAETFPKCLADTPTADNYPVTYDDISYQETFYVGYRFYDKYEIDVLFPFGHGLSYTSFKYDNIRLQKVENNCEFDFTILVDVENVGKVPGKTVAQLYVTDLTGKSERCPKDLKGFEKVLLDVNEKKTVSFTLNQRSFAWWDQKNHKWTVSSGNYKIIVGQSSRDENSLVIDLKI